MSADYFVRLVEMNGRREPFAVATVIETEGSASAKPGSKAIIDSAGVTVFGWVGGGCAESAVCYAAVQSFKDGRTRILTIDLNDEVLGAELRIAGKEHHETTKVDDQERQQDELDRQIAWKARVVPEDRTHHELNEQKRDVRLEIARADRLGVAGDQTAIGLSGIGYGFVHPTFGRSAGSGARSVQSPH